MQGPLPLQFRLVAWEQILRTLHQLVVAHDKVSLYFSCSYNKELQYKKPCCSRQTHLEAQLLLVLLHQLLQLPHRRILLLLLACVLLLLLAATLQSHMLLQGCLYLCACLVCLLLPQLLHTVQLLQPHTHRT